MWASSSRRLYRLCAAPSCARLCTRVAAVAAEPTGQAARTSAAASSAKEAAGGNSRRTCASTAKLTASPSSSVSSAAAPVSFAASNPVRSPARSSGASPAKTSTVPPSGSALSTICAACAGSSVATTCGAAAARCSLTCSPRSPTRTAVAAAGSGSAPAGNRRRRGRPRGAARPRRARGRAGSDRRSHGALSRGDASSSGPRPRWPVRGRRWTSQARRGDTFPRRSSSTLAGGLGLEPRLQGSKGLRAADYPIPHRARPAYFMACYASPGRVAHANVSYAAVAEGYTAEAGMPLSTPQVGQPLTQHRETHTLMTTLVDERQPASAPKPVYEGTKRYGEQIMLYTFVIVPFLAFLAAVPVVWGWGMGWTYVALFAVFYYVSGLGVTVGYHRMFTHGSFKAIRPLRIALAIA